MSKYELPGTGFVPFVSTTLGDAIVIMRFFLIKRAPNMRSSIYIQLLLYIVVKVTLCIKELVSTKSYNHQIFITDLKVYFQHS